MLEITSVEPDAEHTAMGWPVVPSALTELLVRLERDYGDIPLLITENGAAFDDELDGGDVVEDDRRLEYVKGHIEAVERARRPRAWTSAATTSGRCSTTSSGSTATTKRFGIVFVDFPTQRRIPKRSALWYRDLIAAREREERERRWPGSSSAS